MAVEHLLRMSDRLPPADMLLLRERQRRMRTTMEPPVQGEELLVESDAIVDEAEHLESPAPVSGAISLYHPLAHVTLAHMPWSGAVDHVALQNAIVCSPVRDEGAAKAPSWLRAVATLALLEEPRGDACLFVSLAPDDVAMLSRIGTRLTRPDAMGLVLAAALPVTIVGADTETVSGAATVFAAYRHAALVYAWQVALIGQSAPDTGRDRDAAAVQLLSTLRALLGEA
jgi:hypothetical protein